MSYRQTDIVLGERDEMKVLRGIWFCIIFCPYPRIFHSYCTLGSSYLGSAWTLEDDAPKTEVSTVDGTPFSQTSNQLYYKTRPALAKTKKVS